MNVAAVILYHRVIGAIIPLCHIWDLAAAHGIRKNTGCTLEYISGREVDYSVRRILKEVPF